MKNRRFPLICLLALFLVFNTGPAGHADCGDGVIQAPEECDDGNLVAGDGCSSYCLIEECTIHYDCQQGEFCYKGTCLHDPKQDVYHCGKAGCPPGHWCMDAENNKGSCPEDETYVCQTACDCGPAHACIEITGIGKRCVKDLDDPWVPGGVAIYGVVVPQGEPTYCCAFPDCFAGRSSYVSTGTVDAFRCYDSYRAQASNFCGGRQCYYQGDCVAGEVCVETAVASPVPGALCDFDKGRCVSGAMAEAIFGFPPGALLVSCETCPEGSDWPCEQGWRPGGAYAVERVTRTCNTCGNGVCDPGEYPGTCPADCTCGDGKCDPSEIGACSADCGVCGDNVCQGLETPKNCPADCTWSCGDFSCSADEGPCPQDCPCENSVALTDFPSVCGDNYCQEGFGSPENCVTCPQDCSVGIEDSDGDGILDCIDACPGDPQNDADGDGVCVPDDNCPSVANPDQTDTDADGQGNACDADDDNDGVADTVDNCPLLSNAGQSDSDGDGAGDLCDSDDDNDGIVDGDDTCLATPLGATVDSSGCAIVDLCPCDNEWKNHGAYVKCVAHASTVFRSQGLITEVEKETVVSNAAESECGHKK